MSESMIEALEGRRLCAATHPTFVEAATVVQVLALSGADLKAVGSDQGAFVVQARPAGEAGRPLAIAVLNDPNNTLVVPGPLAAL